MRTLLLVLALTVLVAVAEWGHISMQLPTSLAEPEHDPVPGNVNVPESVSYPEHHSITSLSFMPMSKAQVEQLKNKPDLMFDRLQLDSIIYHGKPVFPHTRFFHPERVSGYSSAQISDLLLRTHVIMMSDAKLKALYTDILEAELMNIDPQTRLHLLAHRDARGEYHDFDDSRQTGTLDHDGEGEGEGDDNNDPDRARRFSPKPFVPLCSKFIPGYDDNDPALACNRFRQSMIDGTAEKFLVDDVRPNTDGTKCSLGSTNVCNMTGYTQFRSWPCFLHQDVWTMFCIPNNTEQDCRVNTRPPFTRQFFPTEIIPSGFTNITYIAGWFDPVGGQNWGECRPDGAPINPATGFISGSGRWTCLLTSLFYAEKDVQACEGEYWTKVQNGTFKSPCFGETKDCAVHRGQNILTIRDYSQIWGGVFAAHHYPYFNLADNATHIEPSQVAGGIGVLRAMGNEQAAMATAVQPNIWIPIGYLMQSYPDRKGRYFKKLHFRGALLAPKGIYI